MRRFRPYFRHLRPVRLQLVLGFLALGVYSAASGAGLPALLEVVFKPIFESNDREMTTSQLFWLAAIIPAVFTVRGLAGYASSYLFQFIGTRVLEAVRVDYFRKLQDLPLSFLQRFPAGELTSRAISDTQQLQSVITAVASDGVKHPLTLLFAIGFVTYKAITSEGVMLALVCIAIVPLCVFPIRYVGRKVLRRAHQAQAEVGSVSSQLTENLSAAREVRAFGLEQRATDRFAATSRALVRAQMKITKYAQALNPTIEIVSSFGIALTIVYAYRSGVTMTSLTSVLTALYLCYEPIKKLGYLNSDIKRGTAALDRLEPILTEPIAIADPAQPVEIGRLRGEVAFNDVRFAYREGPPVLDGVTIKIPAGTVCALVGPAGAGKSTFANLVSRFYDVSSGSVKIDDIELTAMRVADLRRNIAIVSQDPFLFNDTIYQNILLGRPDATRADVEQAARDAFAHDFISAFPQGYETVVGERGGSLSGGQRQRVTLARAFLRNAPLLILDEATSALDSETEAAIQQALKKLVVGKTVLIIAHRFSTIRDASMILLFDKGRIIASGDHARLYTESPLYKSLYDLQSAQTAA